MNALTKILLTLALAAAALTTQAGNVRGYFRSNGTYVAPHYRSDAGVIGGGLAAPSLPRDYNYRNPNSAYPSVDVRGYLRTDGTMVAPHYRTPANSRLDDNLTYRGNGTIRVPKAIEPDFWK